MSRERERNGTYFRSLREQNALEAVLELHLWDGEAPAEPKIARSRLGGSLALPIFRIASGAVCSHEEHCSCKTRGWRRRARRVHAAVEDRCTRTLNDLDPNNSYQVVAPLVINRPVVRFLLLALNM